MIEFACHNCGRTIRVPDKAVGRRGTCVTCKTVLFVPNVSTIATEAPAPAPQPTSHRATPIQPAPKPVPLILPSAREQFELSADLSNGSTATLGLASIILGLLGLTICWVPKVGLVGTPLCGIGILLSLVALFVSAFRNRSGTGFAIVGTAINGLAVGIAVVSSSAFLTAFLQSHVALWNPEEHRTYRGDSQSVEAQCSIDVEDPASDLNEKNLFKASIPKLEYGSFRDFERDTFGDRHHLLRMMILIETPERPIRSVRGQLRIVDQNDVVLFEHDIEHTPDVSFEKCTAYFISIDPYDDKNASHRALRFNKEKDLIASFDVTSVVFADGEEKQF